MQRAGGASIGAALAVAGGIGWAFLLSGCSNQGRLVHHPSGSASTASAQADAAEPDSSTRPSEVADAAALAAAQAHAQRIAQAIEPSQGQASQAPPVLWIEPNTPVPSPISSAQAVAQPPQPQVDQAQPLAAEPAASTQPTAVLPPDEPAAQPAALPLSRKELFLRLWNDLDQSDEPAWNRALAAAVLSVADAGQPLDVRFLEGLDPAQKDLVQRYRQIVLTMKEQLQQHSGSLTYDQLQQRLDELLGQQPIDIRRVALCRRVMGYGVYEPFDSNTFLAGRDQKMILYAELDQYRSVLTADDEYEVKLQQEVVLYNEADGLAVWRQEPVQIVDRSRNRRRDFFVVQLIHLPARLGVGKYRLKLRVTDLHGGSIDETTTPIQIVADPALVQAGS